MKLRLWKESRKLGTVDWPIIAILGVGGQAVAPKNDQNAAENMQIKKNFFVLFVTIRIGANGRGSIANKRAF